MRLRAPTRADRLELRNGTRCAPRQPEMLLRDGAEGSIHSWLQGIRAKLGVAGVLGIVAFAVFAAIGWRTPVDVDEGFYGLAGELVSRGRVPYRDFFYPQAPLHPYVLAPFIAVLGAKLRVLRIVSASFAGVAAALVAHAVHRETRSTSGTALAVALFVGHELSWQWLPTVRPYGIAEVCILGSLLLATPPDRDPRPRELLFAGTLAAAAPLARLPLAPVAGVVPLALLLRGRKSSPVTLAFVATLVAVGASLPTPYATAGSAASVAIASVVCAIGPAAKGRLARVAWYVLGTAIVLALAMLVLFLSARPDVVIYDVVGFHADSSTFVTWPENRAYLASSIGGGAIAELSGTGAQNAILLAAALSSLAFPRNELRFATLLGALALVIGASRHQPAIEHYLTPIVGYLAIGAGVALGHVDRAVHSDATRRAASIAFASVLCVFVLVGWTSFEHKWFGGKYGHWDDRTHRPASVDAKLALIGRIAEGHPGPLLATWPGSLLGNGDRVVHGYENNFARIVATKRSPEESARIGIVSDADFRAAILTGSPAVVVLDRESGVGGDRAALARHTLAAGYVESGSLGDVTVYVRGP